MNEEIELTVLDIKAVIELITLMCSRGAVKPHELAVIGTIYNKYLSILEKVQQKDTSPAKTTENSKQP